MENSVEARDNQRDGHVSRRPFKVGEGASQLNTLPHQPTPLPKPGKYKGECTRPKGQSLAERHAPLGAPIFPLAFSCMGVLLAAAEDAVCHLEPMGVAAEAGCSPRVTVIEAGKVRVPVTDGVGSGNQSLLWLEPTHVVFLHSWYSPEKESLHSQIN